MLTTSRIIINHFFMGKSNLDGPSHVEALHHAAGLRVSGVQVGLDRIKIVTDRDVGEYFDRFGRDHHAQRKALSNGTRDDLRGVVGSTINGEKA